MSDLIVIGSPDGETAEKVWNELVSLREDFLVDLEDAAITRPSDRDLRTMELYADFAGEALTAHLGRPCGDGRADPVGRALVTALRDLARVREPDVSVPFELWS